MVFWLNAFAQVPSNIPVNGLQGWYPFTGNANNLSGAGSNGVVNGAVLTTDRFGNTNAAYGFNGTSSSISFPNLFVFNQNSDASISIWINKATLPNVQGTFLFSTKSIIDANRFNFYFNNTNSKMVLDYRQPETLHILNIIFNFQDNIWQNVIYSRVGNVYKLYVNGQFINSITDASPNLPTAVGWMLGADPTGMYDFSGKLDDIGIWNRGLNQEEITSICNANTNVGINIVPQRSLHVKDVIRLEPRSSAPDNPNEGDIYYDFTLKKLRVFDGTVWQNCW